VLTDAVYGIKSLACKDAAAAVISSAILVNEYTIMGAGDTSAADGNANTCQITRIGFPVGQEVSFVIISATAPAKMSSKKTMEVGSERWTPFFEQPNSIYK